MYGVYSFEVKLNVSKMKKALLVILVILCSLVVYSKDNVVNDSAENSQKVVINHKMIENFNSVQSDESGITFLDLIRTSSAEDVKLMYHAYQHSEITLSNKESIDEKIAELKSEVEAAENDIKQTRLLSKR